MQFLSSVTKRQWEILHVSNYINYFSLVGIVNKMQWIYSFRGDGIILCGWVSLRKYLKTFFSCKFEICNTRVTFQNI